MASASNHSLRNSILKSIVRFWWTRSTKTLFPSNLVFNLLYIVLILFYFHSCFLFLLFSLHLFFILKKKILINVGLLFLYCFQFCCGGTLRFYALRTMLVSVVGVGVHWVNVTMRSLYVQWVKFFKICLF